VPTGSMKRRGLMLAAFIVGSAFASVVTTGQPLPGASAVAATTTPTTACTWFFGSAAVGTEFNQGDSWQGGTFTTIESGNIMLVRLEDDGAIVGRFPMGFLNCDSATITFGSPIHITSIIWHDNDPNAGEAGWSVNGIAGPLTGNQMTVQTSVDLTTSTVNIDAGGDSGGIDFCFTTTTTGGGAEGCTPGYWKNHVDSWPATGFATGATLESVFDVPDSLGYDNVTLLAALSFDGGSGVSGGARILLRAAVASLLNSASPGVDFSQTTQQVIDATNAALASGSRATMIGLAGTLDDANNGMDGCPLN
jgi:hypothetical protein